MNGTKLIKTPSHPMLLLGLTGCDYFYGRHCVASFIAKISYIHLDLPNESPAKSARNGMSLAQSGIGFHL